MKPLWIVLIATFVLPTLCIAQPTVFIASGKSDFKAAVVTQLTEQLAEYNCTIEQGKLKKMKSIKVDSLAAVIILDAVHIGKLSSKVRKFVASLTPEQKTKVVLICTTGESNWQYSDQEVMAITSASADNRIDDVAARALARIDALLANRGSSGE